MKIAFDFSVVSNRQLAVIIMLLVVVSATAWPFGALGNRLGIVLAGFAGCAILWNRRWWLVMHPASQVANQLQQTLQATCVHHEFADNSVQVISTGTKVKVHDFGRLSLVEFFVIDRNCNKERFLIEVLTKYLRFIGKKDADG